MRFLVGIFCLFLMTCIYAVDDSGNDGEEGCSEHEHCIDDSEPDEE